MASKKLSEEESEPCLAVTQPKRRMPKMGMKKKDPKSLKTPWHKTVSSAKKSGGIFFQEYVYIYIWMFPKIVVPQSGWFIMEHLINMDD